MAAIRCMLVVPDGPSRRVTAKGVIIGRQADCDVVGLDPEMSRRHALVRISPQGVEVLPIGGTVSINDTRTHHPQIVEDGALLGFPGLELRVEIDADTEPTTPNPSDFVVERTRGGTFGFPQSTFAIGGSEEDDLYLEGWPAAALAFHRDGDQLYVVEDGERRPISIDEPVVFRDEQFAIRAVGARAAITTGASGAGELPRDIVIEMLPRGGLIVFTIADGERTVYFPDRRFDLMMALLQPPQGYTPGETLSDDTLSMLLWPRKPTAGRTEINTLILRCRRDLVDAGLNGARILQRVPGGGGTRLGLARNATIRVKR